MKVYVVRAFSGMYDDRFDRTIAVYTNEEQAAEHCRLAKEESLKQISPEFVSYGKINSLYDPNGQYDYGYIDYDHWEVPLVRHVDEFLDGGGE